MILGAVAASVTVAVLMERFAYRPLRHAPRLAPLITAIGVSVFLQEAVRLFYPGAKSKLPFPQIDVVTGPALEVGGLTIQRAAVFTIGVPGHLRCAPLVLRQPDQARARHEAVSQDPDTARLMGINVNRIIVIAFAVGPPSRPSPAWRRASRTATSTSGSASSRASRPSRRQSSAGSATSWAPSSAGSTLGVVEALATQFIPGQFGGSSWKDIWAFGLLIIVLVFRPQGLLGAQVVDRA